MFLGDYKYTALNFLGVNISLFAAILYSYGEVKKQVTITNSNTNNNSSATTTSSNNNNTNKLTTTVEQQKKGTAAV